MAERPTFSFVIPSYNYGHFLEETLESIFDQGRTDVQVILVDDASDDDTPEIAARYVGRVEYIRNETNQGAGGAWRIGLARARGQYVMKLDADDKLLPGFCAAIEQAFLHNDDVGIVIGSVLLHEPDRKRLKPQFVTDADKILSAEEFRSRFLRGFFFRVPGSMIRRELLSGHEPPDPGLYQIHDWEYLLRVTSGHKAALIREPLAQYRIHDRSITATAQQEDRLYRDILRLIQVAERPGERHIGPEQLRILKGSCAALMLIGFGSKLDPSAYARYFSKYRKAFKLASEAGISQLLRLHGELFLKIFRHVTFIAYR